MFNVLQCHCEQYLVYTRGKAGPSYSSLLNQICYSDTLIIRSCQSLFSFGNTVCTVQSLSCLGILCVITTFPSHGETLVIVSNPRGTYLNIVPTTYIWM